jgi:hypothetical protein
MKEKNVCTHAHGREKHGMFVWSSPLSANRSPTTHPETGALR